MLTWYEKEESWSMTAHEDCGWATIAPIGPNNEFRALEDYVDVNGIITWANQVWDMVQAREIPKPSKLIDGFTFSA